MIFLMLLSIPARSIRGVSPQSVQYMYLKETHTQMKPQDMLE